MGAQHDVDQDHQHSEEEELLGISLLWDAKMRSLVALYEIAGASATLASKINDSGQVIGQVEFQLLDEEDEDEDHGDEEHESHGHQALVLTPVQPPPNTFFRDTPQDSEDHDHDH